MAFMVFSFIFTISGAAQEAPRYFPLEEGNAWVDRHEHIVYEGIVIKPAGIQNKKVTADTLTMRVNGTIEELGKTYAILELGNTVLGHFRAEGDYLYKKYDNREGKLADFTPSDDVRYEMKDVGFLPTYREVETRTLPCGVLTGCGCEIERNYDALHEGKYMFFADSIGPAFFSFLDAWKIPPESDTYSLISYDVRLHPSRVQDIPARESPELHPAAPNPFNSLTTLTYTLPAGRPVRIGVYSITGEKVAVLTDECQLAGTHHVSFDGAGLASGVYFACLEAGGCVKTAKMLLVK